MFDGTELSLVYGDMSPPQEPQLPPPPSQQQSIKQAQVPPDVASGNDQVPEDMYQQQQPKVVYKEPEPTFWDKLGSTRNDIFKLFIFALVILVAISLDRFLFFYIKNYIDENMMNPTNEFLFRLSYPVALLVLIWLLKSM